MSAAEHIMDPERGDSHRLLAAFLLAALLHVVIFIGFAIVRLAQGTMNPVPVSVELMPGTLSGPALAGPPSVAVPQGQIQSARSPAQASAGSAQGFVIPTPRQGAGAEAMQPTGPAFRVAGPSSAQTSSVPPATSPVQEPVLPRVATPQQGTGAATSGGNASAGAPARGVLVQGGGQAAAQGSLDLGALDKPFANVQGSGGAPGAESEGGGSGGGDTTVGNGGGQGDYRFHWDQPAAAAARKQLASPQPVVPLWVSKQGLSLTVQVSFTLTPDGLLRDANVESSSGYNEVDAAVLEAVRLWRFTASPSSPDIHGLITYAIRAR